MLHCSWNKTHKGDLIEHKKANVYRIGLITDAVSIRVGIAKTDFLMIIIYQFKY
jgi:hypothetical protein